MRDTPPQNRVAKEIRTVMFLLIKNAELFSPSPVGMTDILIAGTRIVAIERGLPVPEGSGGAVLDAGGGPVIPGLIDAHVHIAGGGGEGGPATRTPELQLSAMIIGGVTTVVGCLGTDGFTRSVESVLMKAKALRAEGGSAWIYTGAYQVPPPTITGEIGRDIALIEEVIGAGEIALSDHRSSVPSQQELIRIAEHARVGGMLGGKAGIVNVHLGDAADPFRPIHAAVEASELNYKQFLPTHCNRNRWIFEDAKEYGAHGWVDFTAASYPYFPDEEIKPSRAIRDLLTAGVPLSHITMTSDANGSLPGFDSAGNLERLEMGSPSSVLREIRDAVLQDQLELETALAVATVNPAAVLKLPRKGAVAVGNDADLVVLTNELEVASVIANGAVMMQDGEVVRKGTYE